MTNINNQTKEERVKTKGYVTPKFVVVAVVAAGAGAYIVGRSRGFISGIEKGRGMGYMQGVSDAKGMVNEVIKGMDMTITERGSF